MTDSEIAVYAVIPVFNGWDNTRICLDALINSSTAAGVKIIVVDHGSTDGTGENLAKLYPQVRRISGPSILWWAGATNLGIKAALDDGATHLVLLNNDSYVENDTIATLLRHALRSPDSVIAPVQKSLDAPVFVGAATTCFLFGFPSVLLPRLFHLSGEVENILRAPLIMGARGVLLPKSVIEQVGLFDEDGLPHYGADHDFYLRCRNKGVPLLIATDALIHIDNSKTTLAKNYANMSVSDFIATLKDRRSHRNVRDLGNLFRLHYPIKRLYWIGVGLNLARHAAKFIVGRLWHLATSAGARRKKSTQGKVGSNQ